MPFSDSRYGLANDSKDYDLLKRQKTRGNCFQDRFLSRNSRVSLLLSNTFRGPIPIYYRGVGIYTAGPQNKTPPKAEFIKGDWICIVTGSGDGQTWTELGRAKGAIPNSPTPPSDIKLPGFLAWFGSRGTTLNPEVSLGKAARSRFYRITLESAGGEGLSQTGFHDAGCTTNHPNRTGRRRCQE
jgi:hypothetical protein